MHNLKAILEINLAKNRYSNYIHPPYELEKKLMFAIKKGNLEESMVLLNDINALERANLSKKPLYSLKYSLVASCTLFTRAIIQSGVDPETAFMLSDHYINALDASVTPKEVQALEYKMLEGFITLLQTHKSFVYNPLINKAIAYIKKNIESKLLISHIADHLGVHPNYLSNVFKNEVGKTILEYINAERVNAIRIYLSHTTLPISEISDLFGFSNATYFSRFCKIHLGVTPTEYRKYAL